MAGYSTTPLRKKLGIRPGMRVAFIHEPKHFRALLDEVSDIDIHTRLGKTHDYIHYFTQKQQDLRKQFPQLMQALAKNGMLWISWPKGSSKLPRDVNENVVREIGLASGMVDVKIAAIDDDWSGLKFVFRLRDR